MPSFEIRTAQRAYTTTVTRGCLRQLGSVIPARAGQVFAVTTADVWDYHGRAFDEAMDGRPYHVLHFPGGEERKRMAEVEALAERMVALGGDRSSVVVAFGGGIVDDLGGFLAAVFMRGIPVIQVPTTLLAQVDAGVGGKTGANLASGKNLVGAFHQPLAVLIDPDLLATLPEREYRAGLYEVLKCGVIASPALFRRMSEDSAAVMRRDPAVVEEIIAESVRIKAEVVTTDEKEGGLRRILNFGHTAGHALEAESGYRLLLHGEAVAFGMRVAAHLGRLAGTQESPAVEQRIVDAIDAYGAIPPLDGIRAGSLVARLGSDKKTVGGTVHFVLPVRIGEVKVVAGIDVALVTAAMEQALEELKNG